MKLYDGCHAAAAAACLQRIILEISFQQEDGGHLRFTFYIFSYLYTKSLQLISLLQKESFVHSRLYLGIGRSLQNQVFAAGVLGSSLEFVPEILWAESVHDLIGHDGIIKHDKLLSAKEIM